MASTPESQLAAAKAALIEVSKARTPRACPHDAPVMPPVSRQRWLGSSGAHAARAFKLKSLFTLIWLLPCSDEIAWLKKQVEHQKAEIERKKRRAQEAEDELAALRAAEKDRGNVEQAGSSYVSLSVIQ